MSVKNNIAFINSQKDTSTKYLPLWDNEEKELENRIFERIISYLALKATGHKAIKEIEKLHKELDQLE